MKVAFRVDAGMKIGGGHLSRCLTLAKELTRRGVNDITFLMKRHCGVFIKTVVDEGYDVSVLPLAYSPDYDDGYKAWVGGEIQMDAALSRDTLVCKGFGSGDWLIVDHYGLDQDFELPLMALNLRIAVLDDLVNRSHTCDLLVDQTFGRKNVEYLSLVNSDCVVFSGADYCLLRPEFLSCKPVAIERRKSFHSVKKILVNFGSTDPGNATLHFLQNIDDYCFHKGVFIVVVVGASFPYVDEVFGCLEKIKSKYSFLIDVKDMAERMCDVDIAVGAAGSTTWERCALGLPSLLVKTAENQVDVISKVVEGNAAIYHDINLINQKEEIEKNLAILENQYKSISDSAMRLVDGYGVCRVVDFLIDGRVRN